jgi:hypothetical protein
MHYITDGGSPGRIEETRRGLLRMGVHTASYGAVREDDLYAAFLGGNLRPFLEATAALARDIERVRPQQILCDAVEFFNPVHDITLPIVLGALKSLPRIYSAEKIYEVPLIRQEPDGTYAVQSVPRNRRDGEVGIDLTEEEARTKGLAWRDVYLLLAKQMRPIVGDLPAPRREAVCLRAEFIAPGSGQRMRYEERARELYREKKVPQPILYDKHYVPVVKGILFGSDYIRGEPDAA